MVSLGVPDTDVMNRAMVWVLYAVAIIFLLCLLAFAIINANEEGSGDDALAPVTAEIVG